MAHFAQLDSNNTVTNVIVINNSDNALMDGTEAESIGIAFCQKLFGTDTIWKQTSYNAVSGSGFRGNFAGIGMTYIQNVATLGTGSTDVFMVPKPYNSWGIGATFARWESPLGNPPPNPSGQQYVWDETAHQADNTVGWALTAHPQA